MKKEIFIEISAEWTDNAEIRQEEHSEKKEICWESLWNECSWKGRKDGNRQQEENSRSGLDQLVDVEDVIINVPATWRWARGDRESLGQL